MSAAVSVPKGLHVVIWGLRNKRDTFRYIHLAWYEMLKKQNVQVAWVDDDPRNEVAVDDKALVFAVNNAAEHLPAVAGARYVLHNIDPKPYLEVASRRSDLLQLQVWSRAVTGFPNVTESLPCVGFDQQEHVLYQPWGTPFGQESWTTTPIRGKRGLEIWIGSVWNNTLNQGNSLMIEEWRALLAAQGIKFLKVPYGWPDTRVSYGSLVRISRIGAAVVGDWQRVNEYVPCRVFKNVSFGAIPVGNTPVYSAIFGDSAITGNTLDDVLNRYSSLSMKERQHRLEFAQKCMGRYTYEAGFNRILERFLG